MHEFNANTRLGILGGGQLGRMLIQSATDFNLHVRVLDGDAHAPCRHLAHEFVQGSLMDYDTVYRFGKTVDVLTIEIEHVNVDALQQLQTEGVRVFPQPNVIRIIQDKRQQKQFYRINGIPTADFLLIDTADELHQHASFLPAFQKLGTSGYDGRGVQRLQSATDFSRAFTEPSVLEKAVDVAKEISVIVARNERGEVATFPPVELVFHPQHHLVEYLLAPAQLDEFIVTQANEIAMGIAGKLGIVGLLAVELFVTPSGEVLVNEVAPRPHNSGHHTIKANATSQFEQHLRAILNLPLGATDTLIPAAMVNLLGADGFAGDAMYDGLTQALAVEGVYANLYGKKTTKPYRKMGHMTIVDQDVNSLRQKVAEIKQLVRVVSK